MESPAKGSPFKPLRICWFGNPWLRTAFPRAGGSTPTPRLAGQLPSFTAPCSPSRRRLKGSPAGPDPVKLRGRRCIKRHVEPALAGRVARNGRHIDPMIQVVRALQEVLGRTCRSDKPDDEPVAVRADAQQWRQVCERSRNYKKTGVVGACSIGNGDPNCI